MDGVDLRQAQLARQHRLREAGVLQEKTRFRRGAEVGQRTGLQPERRQVDLRQRSSASGRLLAGVRAAARLFRRLA
jgi:hypothetical protein